MPDRRRRDRARLAELHARVGRQELGAVDGVRAYLAGTAPTCDDPADLRYLLRVIGDAGMLGAGGVLELIAEALRALEVVWFKQPRPGLREVCRALECGEVVPAPAREPGGPRHPAQNVLERTVKEIADGRDLVTVLRRTTHGVAAVRGKLASGSRVEAEVDVYRRVLARLVGILREVAIDPAVESARLLGVLTSHGLICLASDASPASLEQELTTVLLRPAHERPEALEQILLANPAVEELFAARDDLAQVLVSWG